MGKGTSATVSMPTASTALSSDQHPHRIAERQPFLANSSAEAFDRPHADRDSEAGRTSEDGSAWPPPKQSSVERVSDLLSTWPSSRLAHFWALGNRRLLLSQAVSLGVWFIVNFLLVRQSWYLSTVINPEQPGSPTKPHWFDCVQPLWYKDDGCGVDGLGCKPFTNITRAFRCPARCGPGVGLLNPRVVGAQVVNYAPLVVGGGGEDRRYRADSFVCQAAVHAGVASQRRGGCGVVRMTGEAAEFVPREAHGIRSIGFPAGFPSSFVFVDGARGDACEDLWTPILAFNIIATVVFTLILKPGPELFFWLLCVLGYWTVVFAADPNAVPPSLSKAIANFLPFLFVCRWLWDVAWMGVVDKVGPLEKVWVYLLPWWVGVLLNLTTAWIPIDRLTPSDISQRPGSLMAVIILAIVAVILVGHQVWCLKKANRWSKFSVAYLLAGVILCLLLVVPEHSLRLHHYFLGILFTPLTSVPTRLSGAYQAFLLGMIQNGVARWSFASILEQTTDVLGDAYRGGAMPEFDFDRSGLGPGAGNLTVSWKSVGKGAVGVMVNDVLRYVGTDGSFVVNVLHSAREIYFRLAFFADDGTRWGEYTGPATFLMSNRSWSGPIPVA